jgi:hypothetical protein
VRGGNNINKIQQLLSRSLFLNVIVLDMMVMK